MKGFPNQVAELTKIAVAIGRLADLVDAHEDVKDDGVFGESLVRAGVAGTGHTPMPVEAYLREQRKKPKSGQSFRTTARGLRELFRRMNLIDDSGDEVVVTELGRQAANYAGKPFDAAQIAFWRRVVRNIEHDGDGRVSHPYQVLLRLVARKPGITRAKSALALEAKDDTDAELSRIVGLVDLSEDKIIAQIGATQSNWDNAKKVLPKFAEQLGDVIRTGDQFVIADAPGKANEGDERGAAKVKEPKGRAPAGVRAPRSSREVGPDQIGRAGLAERNEELAAPPPGLDPAAMAAAIRLRAGRLRRHNTLVRELAGKLAEADARLFEDPFDILAVFRTRAILVEVKTLDGSPEDERDRVRDALSQLLYYESFVTKPVTGETPIRKVACFERPITNAHTEWLNAQDIAVVWKDANGSFSGDELASDFLGRYLKDLS